MIKVIDNVVSSKYRDKLEATFYSKNFLWRCSNNLVGDDINNQFGLAHLLVDNFNCVSNYADYVMPLVYDISEKSGIDYIDVYNGRAFLQVPMCSKREHDIFHVDANIPHTVFLYYLNDSDGDTVILDKKYDTLHQSFLDRDYDYSNDIAEKVSPKKGRVVIFDGFHYHAAGIPQTDARCVLNFNVV